ncbi:hypothetical protein ACVR0O_05850 [Streptococcus caviae]|uniref:hypothetical protein n=1 Tax=Streptococcus sp. 'caviae' TaxID=1915004 RepID=UPI00094B83F3|nr:hypothetical protein [Streptococcus sp. 'caviae']OLN83543.1 hypothetical protein BMI76_05210 [Streptococcus sp. 'caviae']
MREVQIHDFYLKTQEAVKDLSPNNRTYFKKLEDYMLLSSFFYDEIEIRELLYGMACDLADADRDGMTAEDYFGRKAQKLADQVLKYATLEKKRSLLTSAAYILGFLWFYRFLSDFSSLGLIEVNLLSYLSDALMSLLVLILTFQVIKFGICHFNHWGRFKFKIFGEAVTIGECLTYWLAALPFIGCVLLRIYGDYYYPDWLTFRIPQSAGFLLVSILALAAMVLVWKNIIIRPAICPILGYLITGFLRAGVNAKVLTGIWPELILPLIIIILSYLIFIFWTRKNLKDNRAPSH